MKIHDISIPISPDMVVWPGDPQVVISSLSAIEKGYNANVSQISMSVHTGTHIDAPRHFLEGAKSIDEVPLEKFIGEVLVMEFADHVNLINRTALQSHPMLEVLLKSKKVLFKTTNSRLLNISPGKFSEGYVGIDTSGALFLADLDLDLIGVDYLSIACFGETERPHQILLNKEIILLEGINLQKIAPGFYEIYCLPLQISGSDGSPARAILIEQNQK